MSLAEIVASNVSMIRDRRSSGGGWESIATELAEMMGEDVNPASLKVAFSRATRQSLAPAPVEKISKPRAAERPAEIVKPAVNPDLAERLRAALTAAEARAVEALRERDSAREVVAKTAADRDQLAGEVEGLRREIAAVKEVGSGTGRQRAEGKQDSEKDGVIDGLRAELLEARKTVDQWERWSEDRGNDAPRSRPIMLVAMVVAALIVGGGSGVYGSRFLNDQEPVKVAVAAPYEATKPAQATTEIKPIQVPEKLSSDRPAGLRPIPPRPSVEGVLTGKTISLLD